MLFDLLSLLLGPRSLPTIPHDHFATSSIDGIDAQSDFSYDFSPTCNCVNGV
jgi:hypothetical protein